MGHTVYAQMKICWHLGNVIRKKKKKGVVTMEVIYLGLVSKNK